MSTSIVSYNNLKEGMRFDAEYYMYEYLEIEEILKHHKLSTQLYLVAKKSKKRFNPLLKPRDEFFYIEIDNINLHTGTFTFEKLKNYNAPSRARRLLEYKDIFISTVRPNRNAVAIFLNKNNSFVCSTGFSVIKAEKINPYFLFIFLKTKYAIKQLVRQTSAAMYPAVNENEIFNIKIINPKTDFQEKIEQNVRLAYEKQILAELNIKKAEDIVNAELNINNLKIKKGNVTIINHTDFLSENRMDAQFFSSNNFKSIFENKFELKPLKQLCIKIGTGLTPAKDDYCNIGCSVLKMGSLTNKGIDWSKIEFANESFYKRAKKHLIQEKDVLLTSSAHALEHIAKKVDIVTNIPKEHKNKLVFVGELMQLRLKEDLISPYYLLMFLKTEIGYKSIQNCIRGQTAHIYSKDIENIEIPIIPGDKQKEIEKLLLESEKFICESSELIINSIKVVEDLIKKTK